MKILALEWLSCQTEESGDSANELEPSLLEEGLSMLAVLVDGLTAGGHQVATLLSPAAMIAKGHQWRARGVHVSEAIASPGDAVTATLDHWQQLAIQADTVWLVAPELDSILQLAIGRLGSVVSLLSCQPPMLDVACDKWLTAAAFAQHDVKHPTTRLLSEAALEELVACEASLVAKRRDGAGCEGTRLIDGPNDAANLLAEVSDHSAWILQPWVAGRSYSLSAFISPHSTAWLHPVQQTVIVCERGLAYRGAAVAEPPPKYDEMIATAERAIQALGNGALGWVGVDLLFSSKEQTWYAIEVNPRLTSSSAILAASHNGNLIDDLLRSCYLASGSNPAPNACPNMIIRLD